MMQKRCKHCKKHSYSSGDWYRWLCPYCGKDITKQKATALRQRVVYVRPHLPQRLQPLHSSDEDTA